MLGLVFNLCVYSAEFISMDLRFISTSHVPWVISATNNLFRNHFAYLPITGVEYLRVRISGIKGHADGQ